MVMLYLHSSQVSLHVGDSLLPGWDASPLQGYPSPGIGALLPPELDASPSKGYLQHWSILLPG